MDTNIIVQKLPEDFFSRLQSVWRQCGSMSDDVAGRLAAELAYMDGICCRLQSILRNDIAPAARSGDPVEIMRALNEYDACLRPLHENWYLPRLRAFIEEAWERIGADLDDDTEEQSGSEKGTSGSDAWELPDGFLAELGEGLQRSNLFTKEELRRMHLSLCELEERCCNLKALLRNEIVSTTLSGDIDALTTALIYYDIRLWELQEYDDAISARSVIRVLRCRTRRGFDGEVR